MRLSSRCVCVLAAAGTAIPLSLAPRAWAVLPATVVQTRRDLATGDESAVPGLPAATLGALAAANAANNTNIRVVWNEPSNANPGFSSNNGNPAIDANGNVYFVGTAVQTFYTDPDTLGTVFVTGATSNFSPTGQSNNRGLFLSTAASGWANSAISYLARDGSTGSPTTATSGSGTAILGGTSIPLSGVGTNVLNGSNNGPGMAAGVVTSPNGTVLFNSIIADVGATTNNGAAFFTGGPSGFAASGKNGDALAGTAGATLALTASQIVNSMSINNSGQFAFASTTAGGDTVTSGAQQNNSGIWRFSASGNTKIMRRGDAAPGAIDSGAGANAAFGAAPINNNLRINSAGDVLFPQTLATTTVPAGFTGAATGRQGVLYYKPDAGAMQLVAQSGTSVPGLPGVNYINNTSPGAGATQIMNNSGTVVFNAKFNSSTASPNPSTGITANVNDQAIVRWTPSGGATVLFQTGVTPVPGVAGATTFKDLGFSNSQTKLNNQGHFSFAASMTNVGSIVPAGAGVSGNDAGLWLGDGTVGGATLVARAGDAAPGMGGLLFGNAFVGVIMNNTDMIVFQNTTTDGLGNNGPVGIFAYGPTFGLIDLFAQGNTTILGANYPLGSNPASYSSASNGDGGVVSLTDSGLFTFFASSSGTGGAFGVNGAIVTMQIPAPGAGAMALLGLAAVSRRRRR